MKDIKVFKFCKNRLNYRNAQFKTWKMRKKRKNIRKSSKTDKNHDFPLKYLEKQWKVDSLDSHNWVGSKSPEIG